MTPLDSVQSLAPSCEYEAALRERSYSTQPLVAPPHEYSTGGFVVGLLCVGGISAVHNLAFQLLFVFDQVVKRTGVFHRLAQAIDVSRTVR